MTNTKTIKAAVSFTKTTPADILSRANAVYAGLQGNPAYPNPPIDLSVLKAAIDGYSSCIAEALDGGKKAIAQRNHQGAAVIKMLRQLGHFVEASCRDDMTIFRSSGFEAVSTSRAAVQRLSKTVRKIGPGDNTGQLRVSIAAVPSAFSYELRWAPAGDGKMPDAWTSRPLASTRPPALIESLTPGTAYFFQVRAVTASGYTDWSDPVTRICT